MSTLNITEYRDLSRSANGDQVLAGHEPSLTQQDVDFTAGETDSAALNGSTQFVMVTADVDCRVLFGTSPTVAANTGSHLTQDVTYFFGVQPGIYLKISVIAE